MLIDSIYIKDKDRQNLCVMLEVRAVIVPEELSDGWEKGFLGSW